MPGQLLQRIAGARRGCHACGMGTSLVAAIASLANLTLLTGTGLVAGPDSQQQAWESAAPFDIPKLPDRCVAVSSFRRGGETLRLALETRPTTDEYALLIEAPGDLGDRPWDEGKLSIGGAKPENAIAVIEPSTRPESVIYQMKVKRAELVAAGPDPKIKIHGKSHPLELSIVGLAAELALLDACSSALLESWGFSKDIQRQLANYPRPERSLYTYASSDDYPHSAVKSGAMGETHALVTVGINGRASDCRIIRTSGHRDLDSASCNIVTRRVRFTPARTSDGALVLGPAYLTMRWELPR